MRKVAASILSIVLAALAAAQAASAQVPGVRLIVTSGTEVRSDRSALVRASSSGKADFAVDPAARRQAMRGFGGAFNEKGWAALLSLGKAERDEVMRRLFSPSEANLSWGRIPIGASDYALDRYSLAPVAGDFGMKSFSIERDRKLLIPYVKAAQAIRPDLRLWGSAWSPPVWMKDNGDYEGGNFIDDSRYYSAYALYLARFSDEYAREGLPIRAVAVQNEPTVVTGYPNGGWRPRQFRTFIRDFAGPLFARRELSTEIWLGTFNDGNYYTFASEVLDDPEARKYVGAVGLQWDGDRQIPSILRNHPGIPIVQTEADCGNWHWMPGFDKDKAHNDFAYAAYTWGRARDYINAGAGAYMLWNLVLDQEGKNIDKVLPWPQNSAVVVDTATKAVTYTPMLRAIEHLSRYVPDGSAALDYKAGLKSVMAFATPSGSIVVELMNAAKVRKDVVATVGARTYSIELPPECFATLIIDRP
jgi:glucosylceramidase